MNGSDRVPVQDHPSLLGLFVQFVGEPASAVCSIAGATGGLSLVGGRLFPAILLASACVLVGKPGGPLKRRCGAHQDG